MGFLLCLVSDCLILDALFGMCVVLAGSYEGAPMGMEVFDLSLVAINTSFLLLSSITYGFAMLQMQANRLKGTLFWLAITGLLGAAFLGLELYEFYHLIHIGATPQTSGFLTAFFALVAPTACTCCSASSGW